ncbi:hypothetical protein DdX_18779 [Ditylenchus destructor]|uniref:DUF4817 domain-containing protein n=1 Tax=Ditylenchus destructor TaxID=166010 RepID=A0AAD4MJ12_9BILA|nr:hypothetical protein DdX_18779 [Ditylenchus destructor]
MSFTTQGKADFVRIFNQEQGSYVAFQRRMRRERGRHVILPPEKSLKTWDSKFSETGSVTRKKSARRKTVRTPENIAAVRRIYRRRKTSTRRVANGLGISERTVRRILKNDIPKFHPIPVAAYEDEKADLVQN